MPRTDIGVSPSVDTKLQSLGYRVADWSSARSDMPSELTQVLKHASKAATGKLGVPDKVYVNVAERLLIIVEEKPHVKYHEVEDVRKGAVSGVKWYLSRFFNSNLPVGLKGYYDDWKIMGIAVSGDLCQQYQHKFSCFLLNVIEERIEALPQVTNFKTESQFLALFNNLDEEKSIAKVSLSSKKINNLLRSIDSQKRPVLLSALMICLHNSVNYQNDFLRHYKTYSPQTIAKNVLPTVVDVLGAEGIPLEKLNVLKTELAFLASDESLKSSEILKSILNELEESVLPLFNNGFSTSSNYDIIGKFYEEFLKYAGVSNVKKGIVLTPRHITTLFTKLIEVKDNDKILDLCCGTGAFLIAGMNAIIDKIKKSNRSDKEETISLVKQKQLLGFEINPTMYICAISNMLFRGDGKSSIHNYDSINDSRANDELKAFGATIGFINPPYSGKENKEDPTPKEITFLTKLLDNCSRYGVVIAPISMYFKDSTVRDAILNKHTLKAVINMPADLFQPNAATHTAIAVFETHRAFDFENDKVLFYDLLDDGFVLTKNKGRTDVYNRWHDIETDLLKIYRTPECYKNNKFLIYKKIKKKGEWLYQAYAEPDYSEISPDLFINTIKEYLIGHAKQLQNILDNEVDEITFSQILSNYYGTATEVVNTAAFEKKEVLLDTSKWHRFKLNEVFNNYARGCRLVCAERSCGEIPLVTAGYQNQGVAEYICENDKMTCYKNRITIDMFGNVFYKEHEFYCDDNIIAIEPDIELDRYVALFLVTVLRFSVRYFDYGRQYRLKHFEQQYIQLPPKIINGKILPDWEYMSNYIKTLPCSINLKY